MSQKLNSEIAVIGHRYRQELRWPGSPRSAGAAAEVVTRPSRSATGRHAAVPDRDGGLRWRSQRLIHLSQDQSSLPVSSARRRKMEPVQ
jgi:hypothetical protein